MTTDDRITKMALQLWRTVFGNVEMTTADALRGFALQEPSVIDGWLRLARSVDTVTAASTLEYITPPLPKLVRYLPTPDETERMSQ